VSIRQVTFSFQSEFHFLAKLSDLSAKVQPVELVIRYPDTPLGQIVRGRHPKTVIINVEASLREFVVDVTFKKLMLLVQLVHSLEKVFKSQANEPYLRRGGSLTNLDEPSHLAFSYREPDDMPSDRLTFGGPPPQVDSPDPGPFHRQLGACQALPPPYVHLAVRRRPGGDAPRPH
jgi:hypothetical protein